MRDLTPRPEDLERIEISGPDQIAARQRKRVITEAAGGFPDNAARVHAAAVLKGRIKRTVGVSVVIEVADPGAVTRRQGKAVRIVDNRPAR